MDKYKCYDTLVKGSYRGSVSYIFEGMKDSLNRGSYYKMTAFDMERLMDHVIELHNDIEALKIEREVKDREIEKIRKRVPLLDI